MAVERKTSPTSGRSLPTWRWLRTTSMKYFVESGSTRPATRLMATRMSPKRSSQRRGRTSRQTSGMTFFSSGFFLGASPAAARMAPRCEPERSAFIDMDPGRMVLLKVALRSGPRAAGVDEGAHAENHEDEQHDGHGGLLFDGDWMRELDSTDHLNVVPDAFGGSEEAEQADGDGDVHEEHALFCVIGESDQTEDGEDDSDDRRDERSRRMKRRAEKAYQAKQNEDYAEHDGELCHGFKGTRKQGEANRDQASSTSRRSSCLVEVRLLPEHDEPDGSRQQCSPDNKGEDEGTRIEFDGHHGG